MLDFTKPMKMEYSGRGAKWICLDVVEICGTKDCGCGGNPEIPCGARYCVDKETGIIYSGLYNGFRVINTQPVEVEAQEAAVVAQQAYIDAQQDYNAALQAAIDKRKSGDKGVIESSGKPNPQGPNEASKYCAHSEDDHALVAYLKCDCDLHGAFVEHGPGSKAAEVGDAK